MAGGSNHLLKNERLQSRPVESLTKRVLFLMAAAAAAAVNQTSDEETYQCRPIMGFLLKIDLPQLENKLMI